MEQKSEVDFFTVPQFEKIPNLFHGVGAVNWEQRNFKRIPELKEGTLLYLEQVHSNIVHIIEEPPAGYLRGDALVTALPRLLLVIKTADCLPVLLVEEKAKIIGAVHCGWKGTRKRVIQSVVRSIKEHYGINPSSLLVALGPCIGPECYEVGEDVRQSFDQEGLSLDIFTPHPRHKGKYLLDLRAANLMQLLSLGVKRENIFSVDFCSHCSVAHPSWRRDSEKESRMLSFIAKF